MFLFLPLMDQFVTPAAHLLGFFIAQQAATLHITVMNTLASTATTLTSFCTEAIGLFGSCHALCIILHYHNMLTPSALYRARAQIDNEALVIPITQSTLAYNMIGISFTPPKKL